MGTSNSGQYEVIAKILFPWDGERPSFKRPMFGRRGIAYTSFMPSQKVRHSLRKDVLDMTLNCRRWGSSFEDLGNVVCPFIAITLRATLTRNDCTCLGVPSMVQRSHWQIICIGKENVKPYNYFTKKWSLCNRNNYLKPYQHPHYLYWIGIIDTILM